MVTIKFGPVMAMRTVTPAANVRKSPLGTMTSGYDDLAQIAQPAPSGTYLVAAEAALPASSVPVVCLLVAAMTRRRGLVPSSSAEMALAQLAELKAAGADVPLVLADQQMPGMGGTQLLAQVRRFFPTARRGLLISWVDLSAPAPFLEAAALGWLECYLNKPSRSPDEQFHRVITGSLEEWWREQSGRGELVTVIADDRSARGHEIRDVLARNSVPFGFYPSDSPEGQAALRRLDVSEPAGPVLSLYTGAVLVDPANAEVAEALGLDVRPAGQVYDVVIVGAGPAGLAAAVYAASEGLRTALLEREAFGGQAGTSSRIRNYLGFPDGVSGAELAQRAQPIIIDQTQAAPNGGSRAPARRKDRRIASLW